MQNALVRNETAGQARRATVRRSPSGARLGAFPDARCAVRDDVTARRGAIVHAGRPARRATPVARHRHLHRPADNRPVDRPRVAIPRRPAGTPCAGPVSQSRRAGRRGAAVALLTGVALAMLVWLIGVAGSDYQESTAPTPVATQVVHVRAGESLNSVAARVAPEMPRQAVIDQIVELNDMGGSALHVGQALLTPAYR